VNMIVRPGAGRPGRTVGSSRAGRRGRRFPLRRSRSLRPGPFRRSPGRLDHQLLDLELGGPLGRSRRILLGARPL